MLMCGGYKSVLQCTNMCIGVQFNTLPIGTINSFFLIVLMSNSFGGRRR